KSRAFFGKLMFNGDLASDSRDRMGSDCHQDTGPRRLPDETVCMAVPGINEISTNSFLDGLELCLSFEVAARFGSEHLIKKAEVFRNSPGNRFVRSRSEDDSPPLFLFVAQICQERFAVGQIFC